MVGRTGSFEVMLNGKLAFSKLQNKAFPSTAEVTKKVAQVSAGGAVEELETSEPVEAVRKKKKKSSVCVVQ
ncbi:hypothetical protein AMEX_G12642 [Astyanax mexicanus]|uniref:Uncharacterized protein n=1 Tax=Astyanax mexicanus TaxID=7994 RepID=A0A8T2LPC3_ASTMX|nr:hypothetical protein AMEX_G12642 [Astyanax mexicanus]